ncbi:ciliogenesis and planar polarity effector 1-like [Amblyraja radiata]|uniref:ciliogenesis and planar polarity effector 1-like n=1 Tax=Amblyraja radiata TaxID=386614 RepID=UPI00140207F4|nr:ciliogenesis and planar polarity effector 1-like [Amblyraja radiata]
MEPSPISASALQEGSAHVYPPRPVSAHSVLQDVARAQTPRPASTHFLQEGNAHVYPPCPASTHSLWDDSARASPPLPVIVGTAQRTRAQLSEMEEQLAALLEVADSMEQDFANTKMLIHTIEHLGSASEPLNQAGSCQPLPGGRPAEETAPAEDSPSEGRGHPAPTGADEDQREAAGWWQRRGAADDGRCPRELTAGIPGRGGRAGRFQPLSAPAPAPAFTTARHPWVQGTPGTHPLDSTNDTLPSAAYGSNTGDQESSADELLRLSGLSGVSDIIADLLQEGQLCAQTVGLSEGQVRHLLRCSRPPKRGGQERKELQEWMRDSRRQRQDAYLQRRALKGRERTPYAKDKRKTVTSRDIKESQKNKSVKKRVTLAENRQQRERAALSLMNDMLSGMVGPSNTHTPPRSQRAMRTSPHTQGRPGGTARGSTVQLHKR